MDGLLLAVAAEADVRHFAAGKVGELRYKARKKPIEVVVELVPLEGRAVQIETLEGVMTANPGDYIITGIKGERYPIKPDIFCATYDIIAEDVNGKWVAVESFR